MNVYLKLLDKKRDDRSSIIIVYYYYYINVDQRSISFRSFCIFIPIHPIRI